MASRSRNYVSQLKSILSSKVYSQETPKAIITIGETGSGKEVLALQAHEEFSHNGGSIMIGSSYYRSFTENYLKNIKSNDRTAKNESHLEANYLSNSMFEHALKNKYNLVINDDKDNIHNFKEITERLKENGYKIEVRAMATPHEIAMLRGNMATEAHRGNLNFGDVYEVKNYSVHDIAEILDDAEHHLQADNVKVYDRVGNNVYNNEKNANNTWIATPEASKVFKYEAEKTKENEFSYNQMVWHELLELKRSANAPKNEINQIIEEKEKNAIKNNIDSIKNNLITKNAENYKNDVKHGILLDKDEDNYLIRVNERLAIQYRRDTVEDDHLNELAIGQQVYMQHGANNSYKVMDEQSIENHLANMQVQHETQYENQHNLR